MDTQGELVERLAKGTKKEAEKKKLEYLERVLEGAMADMGYESERGSGSGTESSSPD